MAIDEKTIIDAVSEMGIAGDEQGLIPVFGVYLANMYIDYYNDLSFELEREMEPRGLQPVVAELLIDSALQCAYNTFYGITTSAEWDALVQPTVETREDVIHGIVAVTNALGWGRVEVAELVPAEKLTIRIFTGYEAEGYQAKYGKANTGKCYMWVGVASGWMDIVYGESFPNGIYSFEAKEIKCRAMGDPYCEITATKVKTM
jgi:hypothetical protein